MEKIGVGIVTYNSENYYKDLFNSIDQTKIDHLVTVNGGDEYSKRYGDHWIQHTVNKYPAVCRNDAISALLKEDCDHIFIIEDDMIIQDSGIFQKYIETSKASGLNYFSFVSTSWESGTPEKRTPRLVVEYAKNISVSFYKNMCNEFTYHHKSCYDKVGFYDSQFRDPFDIDMAYRESQQDYAAPFWWFADITNSDFYIKNNPVAVSRLQSERPDGNREQRIQEQWKMFIGKHGMMVNQIPDSTKEQTILKLKKIKKNNLI
jgi:glycosyltransferase involved in cell wall biosynthesis